MFILQGQSRNSEGKNQGIKCNLSSPKNAYEKDPCKSKRSIVQEDNQLLEKTKSNTGKVKLQDGCEMS